MVPRNWTMQDVSVSPWVLYYLLFLYIAGSRLNSPAPRWTTVLNIGSILEYTPMGKQEQSKDAETCWNKQTWHCQKRCPTKSWTIPKFPSHPLSCVGGMCQALCHWNKARPHWALRCLYNAVQAQRQNIVETALRCLCDLNMRSQHDLQLIIKQRLQEHPTALRRSHRRISYIDDSNRTRRMLQTCAENSNPFN